MTNAVDPGLGHRAPLLSSRRRRFNLRWPLCLPHNMRIIPYAREVAHHEYGSGRLDAHGKDILPGGCSLGRRTVAHGTAPAHEISRSYSPQRRLVRVLD